MGAKDRTLIVLEPRSRLNVIPSVEENMPCEVPTTRAPLYTSNAFTPDDNPILSSVLDTFHKSGAERFVAERGATDNPNLLPT